MYYKYRWAILIATVNERQHLFRLLVNELTRQINSLNLQDEIILISKCDNKEMSIGKKSQLLLEEAQKEGCEYVNRFDDDDFPHSNYISDIYDAIKDSQVDCVGILINMTTNGMRPQICCHSLKYHWIKSWGEGKNIDGYNYVRNVTHFNPVKLKHALKVGFEDKRFGEDEPYAYKLTALCKTEAFLPRPVMQYRYSTAQVHNVKYGIK